MQMSLSPDKILRGLLLNLENRDNSSAGALLLNRLIKIKSWVSYEAYGTDTCLSIEGDS